MPSLHLPPRRRNLLALGAAAALVGGAVAYQRVAASRTGDDRAGGQPLPSARWDDTRGGRANQDTSKADRLALGWGSLDPPDRLGLTTPDGATLALWEIGTGPTVVLPHCWGCSHAIWIPVARRLVEQGHRVVLYDQRGHGVSSRGTAPLSIATLGEDLAAVLADRAVTDAVLAGHSMGGMTVMALAAYRPEVLAARARALVLVSTAAADMGAGPPGADRLATGLIASAVVSRALHSAAGQRFVRGVFGQDPVTAHVDLTRTLFADTSPQVRAGFFASMSTMNLLEGIATIGIPTTVMIGSRDRLTAPVWAAQLVAAIPGARLVTMGGRGHMLPLEDPDAVAAEIERSFSI